MPELNHKLHLGRMNKDLDERLVPNGEYRDALNVEVTTSEGSNLGTLQTLRGNLDLSFINGDLYCVGSIADEQNDKIYWMISGVDKDVIVEYDYNTQQYEPVVVDLFRIGTPIGSDDRALEFDRSYLITGINIIDGMLFWTDNNTEPKRIHIERCKLGSFDFNTQTQLFVRNVALGPLQAINSGTDYTNSNKDLAREHITVIKKSPVTAPVLEMKSTTREDVDGDGFVEIATTISYEGNPFRDETADIITDPTTTPSQNPNDLPILDETVDFSTGDNIILTTSGDGKTFEVRAKITGFFSVAGSPDFMRIEIISSESDIVNEFGIWDIKLELKDPLFKFKFPRFATRYIYEDGEYSAFSPFTEVAFLPADFSYMPKESYNLGMVNNIRYLAIKDFVDRTLIPDDVIAIDILYKESNSPNVYSIKTIKRGTNSSNVIGVASSDRIWEEYNAISPSRVLPAGSDQKVHGFMEITSELIHAVLPSNQLLRPYDNVPRKALAQEITGNRIVYGNYLQNYDLKAEKGIVSTGLSYSQNFGALQAQDNIKVDLELKLKVGKVGDVLPGQYNPLFAGTQAAPYSYGPAKSVKTLRTYQVGVVYIDEFGRETPVFSDAANSQNSLTIKKINAADANKLAVQPKHILPDFAKSFKFFIKETSNEYYNLAMDRWYNAEDGNIWLSFPSAERNKVDLETFLILKKEHRSNEAVAPVTPTTLANEFVKESARYKIIAIENEAPLFVKTRLKPAGAYFDDGVSLGSTVSNFPLPGNFQVRFDKTKFEAAGWATTSPTDPTATSATIVAGTEGAFYLQDYSKFKMRARVPGAVDGNIVSNFYDVENVSFSSAGNGSYTVTFTEKFRQDMAITSASSGPNAFVDRFANVVMELAVEVVENKPEFDGRFFVKIKKDSIIQDRIIREQDPGSTEYYVQHAMQSQYISYADTIKHTIANNITETNPTGFPNFYGTPAFQRNINPFGITFNSRAHWLLSTDNRDDSPFSIGDTAGYAPNYWKKVSYGDNDASGPYSPTVNPNGRRSQSSGWFIDKIEGFRRYKAGWKNYSKIKPGGPNGFSGYGTHHEDNLYQYNHEGALFGSGSGQATYTYEYNTSDANKAGPSNQMQLEGICTIGSKGNTWNNYLDLIGAKGPHNNLLYDYTLSGGDTNSKGCGLPFVMGDPYNLPKNFELDSGIIPSQGIHQNVIHLSYSGVGNDEVGAGNSSNLYNDSSNNYFEYSVDTAQNHVADIEFINTLTTPGTIWRWKEDPGQCLYQTQRYNPTSDPAYVLGEYDFNSSAIGALPSQANGIPSVRYGEAPDPNPFTPLSAAPVTWDMALNYLDGTSVFQSSDLWNFNSFDHAEGQNKLGVALYNYAFFNDYPVDNPTQTGGGSTIGGYNYKEMPWSTSTPISASIPNIGKVKFLSSILHHPNAFNEIVTSCFPWYQAGTNNIPSFTHNKRAMADANNPDDNSSFLIYEMFSAPHEYYAFGLDPCGKWPMMTRDWNRPHNKRRRFQFLAKAVEVDPATNERYNLGQAPAHINAANPGHQHFYLPTNDPYLEPHFASNNQVLTLGSSIGDDVDGNAYPDLPLTPAPGIRSDGMHSAYPEPKPSGYTLSTGDTSNKEFFTIPFYKMVDGSNRVSTMPGTCTWEILQQTTTWNDKQIPSTNPAIWETEPKEDIGLDIYHEVGQVYPAELNESTLNQFFGPIKDFAIENSKVTCFIPSTGTFRTIQTISSTDIRVRTASVIDGEVFLTLQNASGIQLTTLLGGTIPQVDDLLYFTRSDGSVTSTRVLEVLPFGVSFRLAKDLHNYEVTLPFHNCYSFGNGVESDRIRDDFNQVTIDNGPKASTTLEEPYKEERRGSGLIYSGIYNSMSGINNLNQFIQAEKITKDLNPKYGTIQKLHTRNTNLLTLCEDKVFKILANKDALFNADGSANITATENVLGNATPMLGEYGISTNPESFSSLSYRTYFTDKVRGAVIRLSQDGVTAISDVGMKDFFSDSLPNAKRIIGSVDGRKDEYNITVDYFDYNTYSVGILGFSNTGSAPYTPSSTLIFPNQKSYDQIKLGDILKGPGIPTGTIVINKQINGSEYQIITSQEPTQQDLSSLADPVPYQGGSLATWSTVITSSSVSQDYTNYTVSYSESSGGWVSFKSWLQESGVTLNNQYYTFKYGNLYQHHQEKAPRNNFYGDQYDSSVQVLFNEEPGTVKSFQTLNYEGTQSRITPDFNDNQYWDNEEKFGWYVDNLYTDLQEGKKHEFKSKEGKWFAQVQGETTKWLDDGTAGNIDTKEFSYQGVDELAKFEIIDGGFTSYECAPCPGWNGVYGIMELQSRDFVLSGQTFGPPASTPHSTVLAAFTGFRQATDEMYEWFFDNPTLKFNDYYHLTYQERPLIPNHYYINGVDNTGGLYIAAGNLIHTAGYGGWAPGAGQYILPSTLSVGQRTELRTAEEAINYFATHYNTATYLNPNFRAGMSYAEFKDKAFSLSPIATYPSGVITGHRYIQPLDAAPPSGNLHRISCGSGGFSCVQRFDPYGAYPDQATCLADVSNQCAEIPPTHDCVSGQCVDPGDGSGEFTGPNSLLNCVTFCASCQDLFTTHGTTNSSQDFYGVCQPDGSFTVSAITSGTTWTLKIFQHVTDILVYSDPTLYNSNSSSNTYSSLSPGDYYAIIEDSVGCDETIPFTIGCNPVNNDCVTFGPFRSILGQNTSPHDFTYTAIAPTAPNCNNGGFVIQNIVLGISNAQLSAPTFWSVLEIKDQSNNNVVYSSTTTYNLAGSVTINNLPPGNYEYTIQDEYECTYTYMATVPACVSSCNSNYSVAVYDNNTAPSQYFYTGLFNFSLTPAALRPLTQGSASSSTPHAAGNCSDWLLRTRQLQYIGSTPIPYDASAFYGHYDNLTVLTPLCTDNCTAGVADTQVITKATISFEVSCFPVDVTYLKVFYVCADQWAVGQTANPAWTASSTTEHQYINIGPGGVQYPNYYIDSDWPFSPLSNLPGYGANSGVTKTNSNVIYEDPQFYTENMDGMAAGLPPKTTIVCSDIEPIAEQLANGPASTNGEYTVMAVVVGYDANYDVVRTVPGGNPAIGRPCGAEIGPFYIPCVCSSTGSGYNCDVPGVQGVSLAQCSPAPSGTIGTYSNINDCQNQCMNPVPGCTDPTAMNYDPNATVDDGSCIYPPVNTPCPNNDHLTDSSFTNGIQLTVQASSENSLTISGTNCAEFAINQQPAHVNNWRGFTNQSLSASAISNTVMNVGAPTLDPNGNLRLRGFTNSVVADGVLGTTDTNGVYQAGTMLGYAWSGVYKLLKNLTVGAEYAVTITFGTDWSDGPLQYPWNPGAWSVSPAQSAGDINGNAISDQQIEQGGTIFFGTGGNITSNPISANNNPLPFTAFPVNPVASFDVSFGVQPSPIFAYYGITQFPPSVLNQNSGEFKPGGTVGFVFEAQDTHEILVVGLRSSSVQHLSIAQICVTQRLAQD